VKIEYLKATISKFLKDHLPENFRCANDARELVVQCATGICIVFENDF
jgi:hypothetical protein